MAEPIQVLLIDDSVFVLHGLTAIFEASEKIVIVGTARTQGEAIRAIRGCRPDVVLLDVRVGQASGIDVCETLRRIFPPIGVCFFTACRDTELLRSAIYAGAQGYLLKSCSSVDVVRSVRAVAEGKAVVDQTLIPHVMQWIRDRAQCSRKPDIDDCSTADYELLSRIAAGKSNKEIAHELHATPNQIASRVQTIYKRLKISSRSEATTWFVQWREKVPRVKPNTTGVAHGVITRRMMLITREAPLKEIAAQRGRTDTNGRPPKPQQAKRRRALFSVP